jgi:hypothetical protein
MSNPLSAREGVLFLNVIANPRVIGVKQSFPDIA